MANIVWQPQEKQARFLCRGEYECLYGGAAGGGKSDALLIEALRQVDIPHYRGLILRKTYPQLTELVDRSRALYGAAFPGAVFNETKHVWRFPSGAKIWFGAMQHTADRINYQGKRYDFIGFDELTHFSWEEYSYMFSRNRPSRGTDPRKTRCYIRATTNPGGPGHGWVKARFIDPAPPGTPIREEVEITCPDGSRKTILRDRIFIPATVFDNQALLREDPNYLGSLAMLPQKEREALLYGSWDCFEGQYFTEFRSEPDAIKCREAGITPEEARKQGRFTHVIEPFDLNTGQRRRWKIFRSYDFGYARPFSCGWWAMDFDGTLYRILELYGCGDVPNQGLRWTPDQQFREIANLERTHPWLKGRQIQGVADPAIWDASRGESIADTAMRHGVYFTPGDHQRLPGWMQCHYRLQFDDNGYARCYIFDTCKHFIRTIPLMMYDVTRPEDLDSSLEDHIADEWRYLCMSRPVAPLPAKEMPIQVMDPLGSSPKQLL